MPSRSAREGRVLALRYPAHQNRRTNGKLEAATIPEEHLQHHGASHGGHEVRQTGVPFHLPSQNWGSDLFLGIFNSTTFQCSNEETAFLAVHTSLLLPILEGWSERTLSQLHPVTSCFFRDGIQRSVCLGRDLHAVLGQQLHRLLLHLPLFHLRFGCASVRRQRYFFDLFLNSGCYPCSEGHCSDTQCVCSELDPYQSGAFLVSLMLGLTVRELKQPNTAYFAWTAPALISKEVVLAPRTLPARNPARSMVLLACALTTGCFPCDVGQCSDTQCDCSLLSE